MCRCFFVGLDLHDASIVEFELLLFMSDRPLLPALFRKLLSPEPKEFVGQAAELGADFFRQKRLLILDPLVLQASILCRQAKGLVAVEDRRQAKDFDVRF